jgi:hypothetical protein
MEKVPWTDLIYAVEDERYPLGCCSACGFRNWPKLCKKMTCRFQNDESEFGTTTIYWTAYQLGMDTGLIFAKLNDDFFKATRDDLLPACMEKFRQRTIQ